MLKKRVLKNLMLFAMVIVGFTKSEIAHANPNATISDFSLSRTTAYLEESEGGYVFLTGTVPATGQYEYMLHVYFNGEQITTYPFSGGRLETQLPIWKREVGTGYYEIQLVEYNEDWSEPVSTKVLGRLDFEIKPQKVVAPTPEPTPPTSNSGSSSNSGSTSNSSSSSNSGSTSNSGSSSNSGTSNSGSSSNSGTSNSGSSSNSGTSNSGSSSNSGSTSNSGSSSNSGSTSNSSSSSNSGSTSNSSSSSNSGSTSNSSSSSNNGSTSNSSSSSNNGSTSNSGSSSNNGSTSNSGSSKEETDVTLKDEEVNEDEQKDDVPISGDDEEELSTQLWGNPTQKSKSNLPVVIALATLGVTGLGIGGYVGYMTYIKKRPLKIKFKKDWLKFKKRK